MLLKSELRSIPVKHSAEAVKKAVFAYVQIVTLPTCGQILNVDIVKNNSEVILRYFTDGRNYIIHNIKRSLTKKEIEWCRIKPSSLVSDLCCNRPGNIVCSDSEYEMAEKFMKRYREIPSWRYYSKDIISLLDELTYSFSYEKSVKAFNAKESLRKEHFSMYSPLPENLAEYCENNVFSYGYIFISKINKGKREAVCSSCGKKFNVESNAKSGSMTFCPKCGKAAVYRGNWYKKDIVNRAKICIAEKVEGQLILRWTDITRDFSWPQFNLNYKFDDYAYNLHLHTTRGDYLYFYKWMTMPYYSGEYWYRGKNGDYCFDKSYIYTDNLDEVFGDNYYNVNLKDVLSKNKTEISFAQLLNNLKRPETEYLFKLNMPVLASEIHRVDMENTPQRIGYTSGICINKQLLKLYSSMNISLSEHEVINSYGKWVTAENVEGLRSLNPGPIDYDTIRELLKDMSFDKFINYFTKQEQANKSNYKISYLIREYQDYINMSKAIGVDLSHKSVRFPKDIKESHDTILPRFNEIKHEAENETFRNAVKLLYAELGTTEYESDGLCIVLPQLRSDLINEGQSLNHCVGGIHYYENHIAGTRLIFFIRETKCPNKPYFTMEVDMNEYKILQLYGFGDCSAPKEIKAFASQYVKKIKARKTSNRKTA